MVGAVLLWLAYSDTPRLPDEYSETILWGVGSMEALIARADRALYQAKQEGKSRIVLAETPPPPTPPRSPKSIHLAHTPGS